MISHDAFMRFLCSLKHSPCSRTVEMDADKWLLVNCLLREGDPSDPGGAPGTVEIQTH